MPVILLIGGPAGARGQATQATGSFSRVPAPHPPELGRGVVVAAGQETPGRWSACQRIVVGDVEVADPNTALDALHAAWIERRPIVVELATDFNSLRAPEHSAAPVYNLSPGFEFPRDRLQHLVWANSYDARSGELVWWHGRKAARLGAATGVQAGGPADIILPDGTPLSELRPSLNGEDGVDESHRRPHKPSLRPLLGGPVRTGASRISFRAVRGPNLASGFGWPTWASSTMHLIPK